MTATRRGTAPLLLVAAVSGLLGGVGGAAVVTATGGAQQSTSGGAVAGAEGAGAEGAGAAGAGSAAAQQPAPPLSTTGSISDLSKAVLPSVALVSVGQDGADGQGSGFVIREDGYLVTNHHVASAGGKDAPITVTLPGRGELEAELVGSAAAYDIAVLKVGATGLKALSFADEESVQVGQTVVAVGAPLGLDSTVTSGIVSALDRPVVTGDADDTAYIAAVQTDAAINPGNSGGPLLDLAGRVVGVNSAIAQVPSVSRQPSGSIGLGFAIPGDQAERTATSIIETGKSDHPVIGVHIDTTYAGEGALVLAKARDGIEPVVPDGPAARAGVRPGDLIVAIDGTQVRDMEHLLVVLRSHEVGESVQVELRRPDGGERTVTITLAGSSD